MKYCIKHPNRIATYDSPEDWCDECWMDWWLEGYEDVLSPEEMEKQKQSLMAVQRRHALKHS